jgi:hypothetical protein
VRLSLHPYQGATSLRAPLATGTVCLASEARGWGLHTSQRAVDAGGEETARGGLSLAPHVTHHTRRGCPRHQTRLAATVAAGAWACLSRPQSSLSSLTLTLSLTSSPRLTQVASVADALETLAARGTWGTDDAATQHAMDALSAQLANMTERVPSLSRLLRIRSPWRRLVSPPHVSPHRLGYQQVMVTRFAASLRTDNSPQRKEAHPRSHALTSD